MNIFDDCRIPRPFSWHLGRLATETAILSGIAAAVAAIAAAIFKSPVASAAIGAAVITATIHIAGWTVMALISRVNRQRKSCACI